MLRTVWRSGRSIRTRPPTVSLATAAPCWLAASLSSSSNWPILHARCFSVASTTDTETINVVDSDDPEITITAEEPSPKKKMSKKRKRKRPSQTKARQLFGEVAPHMPLKTLAAIVRKLKRTAPKVETDAKTRVGKVHTLLQSAKIPTWAQQRFTEFFLKKDFETLEDEQSFPVTVNTALLETHIDILERARDLSAQRPLLWSITKRRKESMENKKAAAAVAAAEGASVGDAISQENALTIHQSKSKEIRKLEAKHLAQILAERLPEKAYKDLMEMFTVYVEQTTNPKKPKLRMLYFNLSKCASTHIHLVADEAATFFYVDHSIDKDPRLKQREKDWNAKESQFVEDVLEIYDSLDKPAQQGNLMKQNADTLGELDKLRTRPSDGIMIGRDRQNEQARHGRRRKNVHLVFDAMLLNDEWKAPSQHQYTIFVDNLPIDMEETDLFDLYSRCGPVQSAQIFNQREELDPGPLTGKQRREQKVKQRQNTGRNRRRWERPRTPVYSQITFTSKEGYDAAVDPPLRIFGMVVRKHPMRSIRATDMTSLFLEDIPQGMYSLDIEHKLSQLLHPEIYVCLDVGQHDFAEPASCEIKFPSFEMAHYAYQKLQELNIEGSSLQWMRTPEDAMKYWTREYSFEI